METLYEGEAVGWRGLCAENEGRIESVAQSVHRILVTLMQIKSKGLQIGRQKVGETDSGMSLLAQPGDSIISVAVVVVVYLGYVWITRISQHDKGDRQLA